MTRPSITRTVALAYCPDLVFLLGVRGFGETTGNKRGIYDDAIFLVTPDECIGFNANTDPSITRTGIAVLQPGTYKYKQGLHGIHHLDMNDPKDKALYDTLLSTKKDLQAISGRILPYWAYRQASPVTVLRDGQKDPQTVKDANAWPWIDIHRGGFNTTSSEGCQTIHPDQWQEAKTKGYAAMDQYGLKTISYVLIDRNN